MNCFTGPNLNCPKNQLLDDRYGLLAILGVMQSIDENWYTAHEEEYIKYYQYFEPYINMIKRQEDVGSGMMSY